ncbi:hypothetical protein ATO13_21911 [Stappia sp. 22II-S9-Z10]|nr:hypothetical protein ATO13_21911 [Stappia sp. 22II-S9-Z10]
MEQLPLNELLAAAAFFVASILAHLGFRRGKSVPHETEQLELAGAVIDNHMAERLEAAVTASTAANLKFADALERKIAAQVENTKMVERLSNDIRDLTTEVIRSGRSS